MPDDLRLEPMMHSEPAGIPPARVAPGKPYPLGATRTQRGNNNAYCQDNEISWIDWQLTPAQQALLAFVRRLIRLRLQHPVLHRRKYFQGRPIRGAGIKDIVWLEPSGKEMSDTSWNDSDVRCLGVQFAGYDIDELADSGAPMHGDTLLLLLNAHPEPVRFRLPALPGDRRWVPLVNTEDPAVATGTYRGHGDFLLGARSVVLWAEWPAVARVASHGPTRSPAEAGDPGPGRLTP